MLATVTVILKDDSRTIRQKHLIYEVFTTALDDMVIASLIEETKKNFDGNPTDIVVRIELEVL